MSHSPTSATPAERDGEMERLNPTPDLRGWLSLWAHTDTEEARFDPAYRLTAAALDFRERVVRESCATVAEPELPADYVERMKAWVRSLPSATRPKCPHGADDCGWPDCRFTSFTCANLTPGSLASPPAPAAAPQPAALPPRRDGRERERVRLTLDAGVADRLESIAAGDHEGGVHMVPQHARTILAAMDEWCSLGRATSSEPVVEPK